MLQRDELRCKKVGDGAKAQAVAEDVRDESRQSDVLQLGNLASEDCGQHKCDKRQDGACTEDEQQGASTEVVDHWSGDDARDDQEGHHGGGRDLCPGSKEELCTSDFVHTRHVLVQPCLGRGITPTQGDLAG